MRQVRDRGARARAAPARALLRDRGLWLQQLRQGAHVFSALDCLLPAELHLCALPFLYPSCQSFKLHIIALQAFVQFTDEQGCVAAKAAIHGRLFAGETVRATYVTPDYFARVAG